MKMSKQGLAVAGVVAASFGGAWWSFRPTPADIYIDRVVMLIDHEQWAELLSEALPAEVQVNQWTPESFSCLMTALSSGSPGTVTRDDSRALAAGVFSARLSYEGKAPRWTLVVHNTGRRFYGSLATLPLFVNKWQGGNNDRRLRRLADVLEGCGLNSIRTEKGTVLTVDALRSGVEEGASTGKMWKAP